MDALKSSHSFVEDDQRVESTQDDGRSEISTNTSLSSGTSPPSDPHFGIENDGDYKVCRICGDKALGYNFNVISCESCKAFFRRNANKMKEFRCPSNNNCTITVASRRFCQRCRLNKCFDEGMKKEWIMSEDALQERRQRNEGKRFEPLRIPLAADFEPCHKFSPYDSYGMGPTPPKRMYYGPNAAVDSPMSFAPNPYIPAFGPRYMDFPPAPRMWPGGLTPPSTNPASGPTSIPAVAYEYNRMAANAGSVFGVQVPTAQSIRFKPSYSPTLLPTQPYYSVSEYQKFSALQRQGPVPFAIKADACKISIDPPPYMDAQLILSCQEISPVEKDAGYAYVPKTVLANLVSQYYSMLEQKTLSAAEQNIRGSNAQVRDPASACLPLLTRVQELSKKANTDPEIHQASLKCICQCNCGAKSLGSNIGVEKSDKCFGTENKPEDCSGSGNCDLQRSKTERQARICGKASPKTSAAWLSLDEQDSSVWHSSSLNANQPSSVVPGMSLFMWLRMEELIAANQVINDPADFCFLSRNTGAILEDGPDTSAVDVTSMTNVCVRRIIRMCKRISAFKNLCQEDQIALLKGSCTEILVLRGVMAYNSEQDAYDDNQYPTSNARDALKEDTGNCYDEHKRYLQSFEDTWRRDERTMLILGALTLFYPQRRNIMHEDIVTREHDFYLELLRNYLGIIYGETEAERSYTALCDRLETLRQRVHEYAATIFVDVNPRHLEPLLLEVLDLQVCMEETN